VFSVGNGEKRASGENFKQSDFSFITPWCHVDFSGVLRSVYPRVNITFENNSFQYTPAFVPEQILETQFYKLNPILFKHNSNLSEIVTSNKK